MKINPLETNPTIAGLAKSTKWYIDCTNRTERPLKTTVRDGVVIIIFLSDKKKSQHSSSAQELHPGGRYFCVKVNNQEKPSLE